MVLVPLVIAHILLPLLQPLHIKKEPGRRRVREGEGRGRRREGKEEEGGGGRDAGRESGEITSNNRECTHSGCTQTHTHTPGISLLQPLLQHCM